MTPTERLLTILRFLSDARAVDAESAETIRDQMGVYEGTAGARKWRRDIRTLRERGLIETDVPSAMAPNRTGVRLRVPRKPERLHLTRGEHLAIGKARKALRPGISAVSPLGAAPDGARHEIDDAARILRFLEENEDEVELVQLARWLQVPESRAVELLNVLTMESVFTNGLVVSVEFDYSDDDDDDHADDDPQPATVRVFRGRSGAGSPTLGRGMDELGFFPYSLSETTDRLALIDQALAADGVGEGLRRDLRNAQRKLSEWRGALAPRPMS